MARRAPRRRLRRTVPRRDRDACAPRTRPDPRPHSYHPGYALCHGRDQNRSRWADEPCGTLGGGGGGVHRRARGEPSGVELAARSAGLCRSRRAGARCSARQRPQRYVSVRVRSPGCERRCRVRDGPQHDAASHERGCGRTAQRGIAPAGRRACRSTATTPSRRGAPGISCSSPTHHASGVAAARERGGHARVDFPEHALA